MFERFTERARQVVVLAQDEARTLNHNYIGTEHLLLGLLRDEEGLAARVLASLDVTLEEARAHVESLVGRGEGESTTGQVPFTPRGKKVLELSLREATSLGHDFVGTEHVLLGLARENEGVASQVMRDLGADPEQVRNGVLGALGGAPLRSRPRVITHVSLPPRRWLPVMPATLLVVGWLLFAVALGAGVLIGWAIWAH